MISGSWPGDIYVFEGEGAKKFKSGKIWIAKARATDDPANAAYRFSLPKATAVSCADWEGDGDYDLVVGGIGNELLLILNEGTAKETKFAQPVKLTQADAEKPVTLPGGKGGPCVADWDCDGDLDIVVGAERGVFLLENIGTREKPKLAAAVALKPGGSEFNKGFRYKPFVTDWNNDGLPDLLIGNCELEREERDVKVHGFVYLCLREEKR